MHSYYVENTSNSIVAGVQTPRESS